MKAKQLMKAKGVKKKKIEIERRPPSSPANKQKQLSIMGIM